MQPLHSVSVLVTDKINVSVVCNGVPVTYCSISYFPIQLYASILVTFFNLPALICYFPNETLLEKAAFLYILHNEYENFIIQGGPQKL